ncbi:MAG: LysR substrate-binding domain-containing protein, partial [Pseudanabaenaceae cyanobacterium bins.68]|nr:LysR substrate-binding domain-containing protein [Pseudanabaenaceae cyanobacterium bins.68]
MEVYQVKVFLEVARHLSFTEASDVLNLTQPAVSAKIKSLETELGTSLFYRLGRKIQLTEVGEFLFLEGHKLINAENQLITKIEEIKKGKSGNLRIGCTGAIAEGWLPNLVFKYSRLYMGVRVQCLVFETSELLYRAIAEGQIDLGISEISFRDFNEIVAFPIGEISYSLVVAATHPLATKSWLSLEELKDYDWVMLPVGSPSRIVLENRLTELGLDIREFGIETVDTLAVMRTYITEGGYLAFSSGFEFNPEQQAGKLVSIPLQEFAIPGSIYLVQSKRISEFTEENSERFAVHSRANNPIQKFTALVKSLPIAETSPLRMRSPNLIIRTTSSQRPDLITITIGIQNRTIPTVTAGLIMQQLRLLEHFLPRDGRYSSTRYQVRWCDFASGAPIVEGLHSGELDIGVLGDYPLLLSASDIGKTRLVSFIGNNPCGGNALIVPYESDFSAIVDFKDKVIAVPLGSSAHGMVIRSLHLANILSAVKLTPLAANQDFSYSHADGYAHFAPFHNIACHQGKYR